MDYQMIIDVADAKERFLGNEALYKKFLFRFPEENRFEKLEECVREGDDAQAFEIAHALKGVAANLSLTRYYRAIGDITETLRAGRLPEPEKMAELKEIGQITEGKIRDIQDRDEKIF